ncbi:MULTISPECIES: ABC transporter permease [Brucella]|uniref:ABC transporter permease n=1 Tax=Brucella pecoris TaxID=867683 RepID=A0A5C5CBI7_9HYPH|nr:MULTISPECIES: ABC transporter permease [Brucella]MBB4096229.1 peptide/nickel transport system permease protein [Brucella pecoris]MDG9793356.1 ABC transporter permease [Brucella anthropi]MDH0583142.1 ABC transporter permease [Brucella anthropi]MDH0819756.1 ABC transporter permease [Brucella anthropi]MDH2086402.1 ABC transporter permease [Brucella anthropi]
MTEVGSLVKKSRSLPVPGQATRRHLMLLFGKLLSAIILLLVGSLVVFLTIKAAPGSAALSVLGEQATPEAVSAFERQHGLDKPVLVQYLAWLGNAATGDFGVSLSIASGQKISTLLSSKLPATLFLGFYALFLAIAISLVLGIYAAHHRGRIGDTIATSVSVLGISMPDFWLSYVLIFFFALSLGWFPTYGYVSPFSDFPGSIHASFLPALAIAAPMAAVFARTLRAVLLETMNRPYVTAARSFGLKPRFVFLHFTLRNALIPYLTIIGLQIRYILGGVVVVERIFGIPGVGSFMVDGAFLRDIPVLLACTVIFLAIVLLVNTLTDALCSILDPRRSR